MNFSAKVRVKKNYTRNDGLSPLYLDCSIAGSRARIWLHLFIEKKYFDDNRQEIKKAHPRASDYNMIIRDSISRINNIAIEYRLSNNTLTPELLKFEFIDRDFRKDFCKFFENQLTKRAKTLSYSTTKQQKSTLKKLRDFQDPVFFADLNFAFLKKFEGYLQADLKLDINTRWSILKNIKTMCSIAEKEGLKFNNPFEKFKLKSVKSKRVSLTKTEVKDLMDLFTKDDTPINMKRVLQYFLFSCFTGLRISDVQRIDREMIVDNHLIFLSHKTRRYKKFIKIPLSDLAKSFIHQTKEELFDTYSDQKTNEYLKTIQKKQNLTKLLTFHVARHTFATLFLESGGTVEVLQDILGHTKIETTMIYVHIMEDRKKEQVKKMDNFFEN